MRHNIIFAFVTSLLLTNFALAATELQKSARDAVSGDKNASTAAIRTLRSHKQEGLNALFAEYSAEINQIRSGHTPVKNWTNISDAIDSVAMQKDAYSSRLYWHTDLEEALREAKASGKPMLSLRLLGNLNEEFSCANSRFFRSVLYSDPSIADTLREKYVLHWESVRPAPRITIDFGDGRKLVRTITGNSIHYILDSSGMIIDALPGLYSPDKFGNYLNRISELTGSENYNPRMAAFYRTETALAITQDWRGKLVLLGKDPDRRTPGPRGQMNPTADVPTALDAAPIAVTKSAIELPTVLSLSPEIDRLKFSTEVDDWKPLARLAGEVGFSPESIALMRSKTMNLNENEFAAMIANLKTYIALDTAQNEYRLHTTILTWLDPIRSTLLSEFNDSVYSDLFLTPGTDNWLGLYSPDIYSAIENSGLQ